MAEQGRPFPNPHEDVVRHFAPFALVALLVLDLLVIVCLLCFGLIITKAL